MLSSLAPSVHGRDAALSVFPFFERGDRRALLFLAIAAPRCALLVDCSALSPVEEAPPALLAVLAEGSAYLPAALPLLLPSASTVRRLARTLRAYGDSAARASAAWTPTGQLVHVTAQLRAVVRALSPDGAEPLTLPLPPPLEGSREDASSPAVWRRCVEWQQQLLALHARACALQSSFSVHMQEGAARWRFLFDFQPEPLPERPHWRLRQTAVRRLPRMRLPLAHRVTVLEVGEDPTAALAALRDSAAAKGAVGFDCEWRPERAVGGGPPPPALLQLSSHTQSLLLRLSPAHGLHASVRALLTDRALLKVGQDVRADLAGLCVHYRLPQAVLAQPVQFGFFDLQTLSAPLSLDRPGLASLVGGLMTAQLSKREQTSDWQSVRLSEAQVQYAALDAWSALQLKERLEHITRALHHHARRWAHQHQVSMQGLCAINFAPRIHRSVPRPGKQPQNPRQQQQRIAAATAAAEHERTQRVVESAIA